MQDFWPFVLALARHWRRLAAAGAAGVVLGGLGGGLLWSTGYTAVAQIIRYETPDPQLFQPRQIAAPTLASMIDSVEVRARAGARATPPLSAGAVAGMLRISPERNSDILNVAMTGREFDATIALANLYAEEAVRFTQQLQAQEAAEASRYLEQQLAKVEGEIAVLNGKFRALPPAALKAAVLPRPTLVLTKLDDARDQLTDLLARYTEAHPLVQEQRARVTALERQVAELAAQPEAKVSGVAPDGDNRKDAAAAMTGDIEILREVSKTLENQRLLLGGRLRLTRMLQQTPPGYYRVFAPATKERTMVNRRAAKIGLLAVLAGFGGLFLAAGVMAGVELCDRRLKTPADVRRVTRLPVLASLGSLDRLPAEAQARWAFRTWTALQHRLSESPNQGLVCGITSSSAGEGRSQWMQLLAAAANQCGFRVLTITTRPSLEEDIKYAEAPGIVPGSTRGPGPEDAALTTNALAAPAEIAQQLVSPDGPPLVHIPLPGWVWSLERRKEWLAALEHWRNLDNVVILVELPPASVPESVLLAQNLPNLVWLVDQTRADASATLAQLETLRHARCHIVGAVINRDDTPVLRDRLARWLPGMAAVLLIGLAAPLSAPAQTAAPPAEAVPLPEAGPAAFSVVSPVQRAEWQKQLTLGPGDVLRLALYGEPELTQPEVAVQPDGRISFLEAGDVRASGLTIDALRAKLDEELAKFRRAPRTLVAPVAFHSKKYLMLGKIAHKGVFTLDRPLTVVEAVARAHGFETGLADRNVVELADLSRSFLIRQGRQAPVNFEKLFAAGDLTQNIAVEPGDYFYFPPADLQEIYLLGEVRTPGPVTYTDGLTVARAIAGRGGFNPKAWWRRVLVVRGSLGHPQTFTIDLVDVLAARQPDLKLEPRDIVFVSARPWFKAEDLLDDAIAAFAQSVVVFWTTDKVIPVVR